MFRFGSRSIVLVYAFLGAGWILFSDRLADALFGHSPSLLSLAQILKGWFFVTVTALLLHVMIRRFRDDLRREGEKVRASEEKYRLLVERQTDMVVKVDASGRFLYVSPSYCRVFGKTEAELLGQTFMPLVHPEDRAVTGKAMEALWGPPYSCSLEQRAMTASGWRWLAWSDTALPGPDGRIEAIIGVGRDVTDRRKAEEALGQSLTRFRVVAEQTGQLVFDHDPEAGTTVWAGAVEAVTGLAPEDVLDASLTDFLGRVEPEDRGRVGAELELARERGNGCDLVCRYRRVDGAVIHIHLRGRYLSGRQGGLRLVGVVEDITARRLSQERLAASLAEKDILLKEIHHRVKNNLQIISSLLYLQADAVADEKDRGLFAESRDRIMSMALVHEELYRSGDLARVDLGRYVGTLVPRMVDTLGGGRNIELALDVEAVHAPIDKAVPFGLLLNELVTNALKHAFVGRERGRLTVTMRRREDGVEVLVADDGVGLPGDVDIVSSGTLGMQLVVNLSRQIGARLTIERGSGTAFRLAFSAPGLPFPAKDAT